MTSAFHPATSSGTNTRECPNPLPPSHPIANAIRASSTCARSDPLFPFKPVFFMPFVTPLFVIFVEGITIFSRSIPNLSG